jgi:hypothetical protein
MVIVANLELLGRTQALDDYGRARVNAAVAAAAQLKEKVRQFGCIRERRLTVGEPGLAPMLGRDLSSLATSAEYRDRDTPMMRRPPPGHQDQGPIAPDEGPAYGGHEENAG